MVRSEQPFVSCIMPTFNRRAFVPHAIRYFLRQDYVNKELIIIDDGPDSIEDLVPDNPIIHYHRLPGKLTLGAKLNMACRFAKGDLIVNWDDDDWYAPGRLAYQVNAMQNTNVYICGINKLFYYDVKKKTAFQYIYPSGQRTWLLGSSLCYRKEFWSQNLFADINIGMDGLFVWKTTDDHINVLPDASFAVHMIHDSNVSPKKTEGAWWHRYPVEEIEKIMNGDLNFYNNGKVISPGKIIPGNYIPKRPSEFSTSLLKNIYACLVHENGDCIADLVNNLRYHDPVSPIILYNGGGDAALLSAFNNWKEKGVLIFPDPAPIKHGYLHSFALQCMEYSLKNFSFDVLTIVDSDQLCLRNNYRGYLSEFLSQEKISRTGMLSSAPEHVTRENKTNLVAIQAFKEFDLWEPLLKGFPDGEKKFVHWTFWPSTVFTFNAVRDLIGLFKENLLLQEIMKHTKVWATEEVILPTLIRLLGYEIALNPCSYDFVKYRKSYTTQEVEKAFSKPDGYWIHPVRRKFDDPLRRMIREKFNDYSVSPKREEENSDAYGEFFQGRSTLKNKIKKIEGWLSDNEAELLINITLKAFSLFPSLKNIVEIGSYHGKSTVLFGTIIQAFQHRAKVFAIDMHDGKLGAIDQGLKSYPASFEMFKKNIASAGLNGVIEMIRDKAHHIDWNEPISLLFIDGLHDYQNVTTDFRHFAGFIQPGGLVAFHDYADYFPGVKKLVSEILATKTYIKISQADSLIVLQKVM
jgi:glycosyltransferase involved in cell wall biosynthesis